MSRRVKTLIAITTTTIEKKKEEGEEENLIVSTCQVLFSFFFVFQDLQIFLCESNQVSRIAYALYLFVDVILSSLIRY